ncbi:MAG: hypothetical protein A3G75_01360 [Verrucomicrobia bacterium RIFCSPLOWO2_12_FULL_64_8]|nr:MAG: hypothetical protein A3G75_01360 [Verrucomicrobia bacterium RIFCSPLOWO2_12_FULL_64_8]
MSTTLAILIIGLLVVLSAAMATLIYAIRTAVDGYENETGFYPLEPGQDVGLPRLVPDAGSLPDLPAMDDTESGKVRSSESARPFPAASEHGPLDPGAPSSP